MSKYEIIDKLEVLCGSLRCTPSGCDCCPYGDYEGEKCEVDILIENTNGYVACVDKDKKVRRIHIDVLVEKAGEIDE